MRDFFPVTDNDLMPDDNFDSSDINSDAMHDFSPVTDNNLTRNSSSKDKSNYDF